MKIAQYVIALIIAIALPIVLIFTLNSNLQKPKVSQFSQNSVAQEVNKLKVPKDWLGRLPKSMQKQVSGDAKKSLAREAQKAQQKYVQPQIVKYEKGRFAIFVGIGMLVVLILLLGRYKALAWGLAAGGTVTAIYGFIDTWGFLSLGLKWLIVPIILICAVYVALEWCCCKKS